VRSTTLTLTQGLQTKQRLLRASVRRSRSGQPPIEAAGDESDSQSALGAPPGRKPPTVPPRQQQQPAGEHQAEEISSNPPSRPPPEPPAGDGNPESFFFEDSLETVDDSTIDFSGVNSNGAGDVDKQQQRSSSARSSAVFRNETLQILGDLVPSYSDVCDRATIEVIFCCLYLLLCFPPPRKQQTNPHADALPCKRKKDLLQFQLSDSDAVVGILELMRWAASAGQSQSAARDDNDTRVEVIFRKLRADVANFATVRDNRLRLSAKRLADAADIETDSFSTLQLNKFYETERDAVTLHENMKYFGGQLMPQGGAGLTSSDVWRVRVLLVAPTLAAANRLVGRCTDFPVTPEHRFNGMRPPFSRRFEYPEHGSPE
jgi:hypothetical protein